jgi:hypothetical protein
MLSARLDFSSWWLVTGASWEAASHPAAQPITTHPIKWAQSVAPVSSGNAVFAIMVYLFADVALLC